MYELIQVANNTYYVNCPAKMGLYRGEDGVYLIDSGSDKEAGRKVRQILDKNNWRLRAIFVTHSHADHIGGCKYLQAQTGCRVFAAGIERCFTQYPLLEPVSLFGACPPKALRHKFLMAQGCDAEPLTSEALPEGWEAIPLSGHCFEMTGFRTPDDVVFLADCVSSRATLEKYRIGFLFDVTAALETLERVKQLNAKLFVPAHTEPVEDISELAQFNIDAILEAESKILELCREPKSSETVLKGLFDAYGLTLTFEQYALSGSTVRSYLARLLDGGRISQRCEDNVIVWESV